MSIHAAGSGHPGGTLSVMDVAAVLFMDEVRYDPGDPRWDGRDRVFSPRAQGARVLLAGSVQAGFYTRSRPSPFESWEARSRDIRTLPFLPGYRGIKRVARPGSGYPVGCALPASRRARATGSIA